mmetsp:Transcript_6768/g.19163  ORF Transcript_6768/g.19163 Transcript_6768/m.19163 type:complete len:346 (-) Transcript_6768:1771-2808(-)
MEEYESSSSLEVLSPRMASMNRQLESLESAWQMQALLKENESSRSGPRVRITDSPITSPPTASAAAGALSSLDIARSPTSPSNTVSPAYLPHVPGECPICWEDGPGVHLPACQHFFCLDCIEMYISTRVSSGNILSMDCPDPQCDAEILDQEIAALIPPEMFEKYSQFQFLARLRLEPNCRYCPNEDCRTPNVVNPDHPDFPKAACEDCGIEFCGNCSNRWHEGATCEEAEAQIFKAMHKQDRKRAQEELKKTKKALKKEKSRKCPKCGAIVQKTEGCNVIQCICGSRFCYLCEELILGEAIEPMHYKIGACAGLQITSSDNLPMSRKAARLVINPFKFGAMGGL